MRMPLNVALNFYRRYWQLVLVFMGLNFSVLAMTSHAGNLSADASAVMLNGIVWSIENFLVCLVLGLQRGHWVLWKQLWQSPIRRLFGLVPTSLSLAAVTQLLPVMGWLLTHHTQVLVLDYLSFAWAWMVSLLAITFAHVYVEQRGLKSGLALLSALPILVWAQFDLAFQLLAPVVIAVAVILLMASRGLLQKITSYALQTVGVCILSVMLFTAAGTVYESGVNGSTAIVADSVEASEKQWALSIYEQLRTPPQLGASQSNTAEQSVVSLESINLNSAQQIAITTLASNKRLTYLKQQDIKIDWFKKQLANPSLTLANYEKDADAYQYFMQQVELLWRTQNTSTPVFVPFLGRELAVMDRSILVYQNNQSSVLWRYQQQPVTWFSVSEQAGAEFFAFGNHSELFVYVVEGDIPTLIQHPLRQQPSSLSFVRDDKFFNAVDVMYSNNEVFRLAWLDGKGARVIETQSKYRHAEQGNLSSISNFDFFSSPMSWLLTGLITRNFIVLSVQSMLLPIMISLGIFVWTLRRSPLNRAIYPVLALLFSWPFLLVMFINRKQILFQKRIPPS